MSEHPESDPTEQEVKDYEQGQADTEKGVIATVANDIIVNHPDSPAYYDGRAGEPLNAEPKDDDK